MHQVKHTSCPGWVLATTFSWISTGLLVAITVTRSFPQIGWLIPALGAGIWATLALFFAARKLEKGAPENDLHLILYFLAIAFALVAGSVLFFAAIHQALAH
ncbi:hypothetical protein JKG47_10270 [Acidithiobacillus sp. MC6.1]|nr:hypothetical protein [Acidithiobacillus sp. MC6.1]